MLNILTVVGARPQFIKAAVFSRVLRSAGAGMNEQIVHTGQHFDAGMSDVFFDQLDIPRPYRNLAIPGGAHGAATGRMLEALELEMLDVMPDMVLVYGDTNSTLAGALAAAKLHIPVAHIEAGMRSFNRRMPEEINRVLTDHVSTLLFCTSDSSAALLAQEGITNGVHVVGDVMYDAVLHYHESSSMAPPRADDYALLTMHRAENVDDRQRLDNIVRALAAIEMKIYFPVHPRTAQQLEQQAIELPDNIIAVEPLAYLELLNAAAHAQFVITDSGGLQKEAYYLGKKCLCLRDETEWTELVELGINRLTGADPAAIAAAAAWAREPAQFDARPYGHGDAGERIVAALQAWHHDASA